MRSIDRARPRLSRRLNKSLRGTRQLISVTPLVDLVFILLVFFMLASTFLQWRAIDLNSPPITTAQDIVDDVLLIEIGAGNLRVADTPIALEAIGAHVALRLTAAPELAVLIKPLEGVPLQRTIRVLDRLRAAGVADLTLVGAPSPSGE